MELSYTEDYAHPRSHRLPNKKPSARCRILLFKLLVGGVLETPLDKNKLLPLLLAAYKNLIVKTLLLKTPQALVR